MDRAHPITRIVLAVLISIVFFLVIIHNVLLYFKQKCLFLPAKDHVWTPEPGTYEEVWFPSGDHKLQGWFFHSICRKNKEKNCPLLLFCHGNTGNISHRKYLYDLCQIIDANIFLFDYSGFGKSEGECSLSQLEKDGAAAYDYLASQGYTDIIVWCKSLGGIPGTYIAAHRPVRSLLLMATFSDFSHIFKFKFPEASFTTYLLGKLVNSMAEIPSNAEKLSLVKCPVAILHSVGDDLIPFKCALVNFAAISTAPKTLIPIEGGHATPVMTKDQLSKAFSFCGLYVENWTGIDVWLERIQNLVKELGL